MHGIFGASLNLNNPHNHKGILAALPLILNIPLNHHSQPVMNKPSSQWHASTPSTLSAPFIQGSIDQARCIPYQFKTIYMCLERESSPFGRMFTMLVVVNWC